MEEFHWGQRAGKVQQRTADTDKSMPNCWCGGWWSVLDSDEILMLGQTQGISMGCFWKSTWSLSSSWSLSPWQTRDYTLEQLTDWTHQWENTGSGVRDPGSSLCSSFPADVLVVKLRLPQFLYTAQGNKAYLAGLLTRWEVAWGKYLACSRHSVNSSSALKVKLWVEGLHDGIKDHRPGWPSTGVPLYSTVHRTAMLYGEWGSRDQAHPRASWGPWINFLAISVC